MNSIRRKLFIQIGSIVLLFILLLYLANTFLLEIFYVQGAQNRLLNIYDKVNAMDSDEIDSDVLYELLLDSSTFVELAIIDKENDQIILPQNPFFGESIDPKPILNLPMRPQGNMTINKKEKINDLISFVWFTDNKNGINFFMLNGDLDNGFQVDIRIPLASIKQNVAFFNQFILIAGLLILIITIFAANQISKHFTKPILNMSTVTNRIKHLDFDLSCHVSTNDELGQLAENINEMSDALKDNLDELALSNQHLSEEVEERLRIDEQRKTLLNNVSHELKTPLSLVQGYSEGLKINLHKNPEKVDFYCDVIIDEAKKMDLLVSQLLDINHIQFGDFPLHKEKVNSLEFINYILKKYEPSFTDNQIKLTKNLSILENEGSIILFIDALRSEQILTNLMNNALAYVNDKKRIALETTITNNHLRIQVSNSIDKISSDNLPNWWNSFYKEDKARTRENGGYGLGLSIVKAIQEADSNEYGVFYEEGLIHFFVDFDIA